MELFNNKIVANKLYDHQQTPLVMDTLIEILTVRGNPEGVIVQYDQGSVYTSFTNQAILSAVYRDEETVGITR